MKTLINVYFIELKIIMSSLFIVKICLQQFLKAYKGENLKKSATSIVEKMN